MRRAYLTRFAGIAALALLLAQAGLAQSLAPGTEIKVHLLDQLDTGETSAGQTFSATVAEPVRANGRTVLARGARVSGRVVDVVSSGRLKRPASISLELTRAGRQSLDTEVLKLDGKSHLVRNVALIGGGAAAGAILGGVAGGGKGAAIGAAAGAGAGTATAYLTGKQEIVLPVEMELTFVVAGGSGAPMQTSAAPQEQERRAAERGREESPLIFSERQQQIILSYFRSQNRGLPPGLAKRGGDLPPGLERQLRRNGTLPPGLQKRVEPFPWELTRRLPSLPDGYSRVMLSGRAMILDRAGLILDVLVVF